MSSRSHTAATADGSPPLAEVGTRGTIGFLVSQEIEYFRTHDPCPQQSPHKSNSACSGNKKKKKGKAAASGGGGFLPSICSAVEIGNAGGAGYMNLRTDGKKHMQED